VSELKNHEPDMLPNLTNKKQAQSATPCGTQKVLDIIALATYYYVINAISEYEQI
jgi:hypothetical protein